MGSELATGCDSARTPWAVIGEDPSDFFDIACLPVGFKFQDPSRMGMNVKVLLNHLRGRQVEHGVNAFHFHHVLLGNKVEPAEYSDEAKRIIEGNSLPIDTDNLDPPKATPQSSPCKSPAKKRKGKKRNNAELDPNKLDALPSIVLPPTPAPMAIKMVSAQSAQPPRAPEPPHPPHVWPPNVLPMPMPFPPGPPSDKSLQLPHTPHASQPNLFPMPMPFPPGPPSVPSQLPFLPYGFPYNHQYLSFLLQQQSGGEDVKPQVGDGYHSWPLPPATFSQQNIDPQLLPQGEPVFSFPPPCSQPNLPAVGTHFEMGVNLSNEELERAQYKTPSKIKRTPKRKRSDSPIPGEVTPRRSGRIRK